jgi:methyl-accepting chemotaxis protein
VALFTLFGTTEAFQHVKNTNDRSQLARQLELAQNQMINQVLDYAWSDNTVRLNEYAIAKDTLDKTLATLEATSLHPEKYSQLKEQFTSLRQDLDQMISLTRGNQGQAAQSLWRSRISKQAALSQVLLQDIIQEELQSASQEYEQATGQNHTLALMISLLAVLALTLAIGLAFLLTSAFTGPVVQLKNRLSELAGGDLTQPLQVVNRDELGTLGLTYNTTLTSLQKLIKQLHEQSQQVSLATEELTSQAKSQVVGSSQQAAAIAETSQALQELNQTAEEIARQILSISEAIAYSLTQAQVVNGLVEEMSVAQERGRTTVARTINGLHTMKAQVATIEKQQQTLVGQSSAIYRVIELIDGIAKETHLLALNASIEAAGAGAYGERFAVIASQVKQLADRSVMATQEVRGTLGGMVVSIEEAGQLAAQGMQEAEKTVEDAGHSDVALQLLTTLSEKVKNAAQEIVAQVKGTVNLATNIDLATRQQQSSNRQLLERMLEIEAITTQNLSSLRQGESATYQLSLSAQKLKHSADAFKLA